MRSLAARTDSRPAGACGRPNGSVGGQHGEDVDEHRPGGRTVAPEAGYSPRWPQGRGESEGSQDCRDILNAVPKRNPMIVPTAPVRKITSACDIWTDQTRNRTWTTVEFCIAKMMPNRSRIPPRISLNLVVMFFWFSLSSWEVTPRTVKGAGFQMYGLRKFEFKAWIMSSASLPQRDEKPVRRRSSTLADC